jgi:hypothetical protein
VSFGSPGTAPNGLLRTGPAGLYGSAPRPHPGSAHRWYGVVCTHRATSVGTERASPHDAMANLRKRLRDDGWRHDVDLIVAVALIALLAFAAIGPR